MRKKAIFILTLMLLVGVSGLRAAEAYVYLDTTDGCLYFCYDNNRSSRKFTTYNLNTGNSQPFCNSQSHSIGCDNEDFTFLFSNQQRTD